MQDYQKCRICLVAENQVKLFSMFAKQGEDVKNYERLSNITLSNTNLPTMICNRCSMDLSSAVKVKDMIARSHPHFWTLQHCQAPANDVKNTNSHTIGISHQQPIRSSNFTLQPINSSKTAAVFKSPMAISPIIKNDTNVKAAPRSNNTTKALTPPEKVLTIYKSPPTAINHQNVKIMLTRPTRPAIIQQDAQVKRVKLFNKENESTSIQQLVSNRPQVKIFKKTSSAPSSIVKLQASVNGKPQDDGTEIAHKTY